jgi:hypothetical protein
MRNKLLFLFVTATLVSGCVLTDQIRYRKSIATLPAIEADSMEEQAENQLFFEKWEEEENLPFAASNILGDSIVWYHPNDWWSIKTERFPASPDSMQYRMFRPQYGYNVFLGTDGQVDPNRWADWQVSNRFYNEPKYGGHAWQGFISAKKEIISKHPEYLAEINGVRSGIGSSSKLCVSNKSLQTLFCDYVEEIARKDPDRVAISVEPSDGGNFCSCKDCKAIGNTSNQVFFLANLAAKRLSSNNLRPNAYLLAYNLHSETASFPLEKNITVNVIPKGFQTIYQPEIMMIEWAKYHHDRFYRDYFAIPQWTADMPRLQVPTILRRTKLAYKLGYRGVIMETSTNINSAIAFVLFNALWMNPQLTYNEVLDKFISDCFPSAKVPMKRFFYRWHHSWLERNEISAALYDLKEARALITDRNELLRLNDLIVYVNMMVFYFEWSADRKNRQLNELYFDNLYRSSTHNVINAFALMSVFGKNLNPWPDLAEKYKKERRLKTWAKPYSEEEINQIFQQNIKKYGLKKIDFRYITPFDVKISDFKPTDFFSDLKLSMANNVECHIISKETSFSIEAAYKPNAASPLLISIFDEDFNFVLSKFVEDGERFTVQLPSAGTYGLSYNRAGAGTLSISGSVIPVLGESRANAKLQYYNLNTKDEWQAVTKGKNILETTNYYYQLNR